MSGLTPTGFEIETQTEIRNAINASLRQSLGKSIGLTDDDALGRIVGAFSEPIAKLWELAEFVYSALDPDKARDAAFDAIAAITGSIRNEQERSTVLLTLTGTPATLIDEDSRASVLVTGSLFETIDDAVIVGHDERAQLTGYVINDRVFNVGNVYRADVSGTTDSGAGPTHTDPGITVLDGTVEWQFIGAGTGSIDALSQSVDFGVIVGSTLDIQSIETPIGGWSSVLNLEDAKLGRLVESNPDFRIRREVELTAAGSATQDAIRTDLLMLDGVTTAIVFMNVMDDPVDLDGLPIHAIEALVQGGEDQDIFDTLLSTVAAGIRTFGNTIGSATDSQGLTEVMAFSRPVEVAVHVKVTLKKFPDTYPIDGDDQVKSAIVVYGAVQLPGKDVVSSVLSSLLIPTPEGAGVVGVLEVDPPLIDVIDPPTTPTTVVITSRQLATYDSADIDVISLDGLP